MVIPIWHLLPVKPVSATTGLAGTEDAELLGGKVGEGVHDKGWQRAAG
jgi:hypothetical protein